MWRRRAGPCLSFVEVKVVSIPQSALPGQCRLPYHVVFPGWAAQELQHQPKLQEAHDSWVTSGTLQEAPFPVKAVFLWLERHL